MRPIIDIKILIREAETTILIHQPQTFSDDPASAFFDMSRPRNERTDAPASTGRISPNVPYLLSRPHLKPNASYIVKMISPDALSAE